MGKLNQGGANIMVFTRIVSSLRAIVNSLEMWGVIRASLSFDILMCSSSCTSLVDITKVEFIYYLTTKNYIHNTTNY